MNITNYNCTLFYKRQVKAYGLLESRLEASLCPPVKFHADLPRVDGVAPIVTGPVLDEGLEGTAGALGPPQVLVHQVAEQVHQGHVGLLVVTAHAVGLAGGALEHHGLQGGAVVLHVEPVPDVQAFPVDGDGLALGHAGDGQRDELLGMLPWAIVVGAVRGDGVHTVRVMVGADGVVAAGLAGAVGAVGGVGHLLVELALVTEGAVDLVRADVQEAAVLLSRPGLAGRLQHGEGAHDVGLDKGCGAGDAAVHMALRGQMEDPGDLVLLDEVPRQFQVLDVAHHELDAVDAINLGPVRGIGQLVQYHDAVARVVAVPAVDQVAADEAGAAGDEDGFGHLLAPRVTGRRHYRCALRASSSFTKGFSGSSSWRISSMGSALPCPMNRRSGQLMTTPHSTPMQR